MKSLIKVKTTYKIPQLTIEEGVFIVEIYIETESFVIIQRKFRSKFNRKYPCKKSIRNSVIRHLNFNKSLNKKNRNSGKVQSAATD